MHHGFGDEAASVGSRNADGRLPFGRDARSQFLIQQTGEDHDGDVARLAVGNAQARDELALDGHALERGGERRPPP